MYLYVMFSIYSMYLYVMFSIYANIEPISGLDEIRVNVSLGDWAPR